METWRADRISYSTARNPMIGQTLGHYRIDSQLGAGGMGVVYRAWDTRLQRTVALKLLLDSADPAARRRLLQEARSASALNHPDICTVYEVGEEGEQAFIVMEHVEGRPLSELIPPGGLPVETGLHYGLQIADALAHAHERGIIHRDLKASNVLITPAGRAKVLDFGLAKRLAAEELSEGTTGTGGPLTEAGAVVGTLPYMSPEQLRGQHADARSDVWALGVLIYEMLSGLRPFQGQTAFELSSAILSRPPAPLRSKVPVGLRAVVDRCLEKESARRYRQGGEVRAALETVQTGAVPRWTTWRYRRRQWWVGAAAVTALIAAAAALDVAGLRTRLFGGRPRVESVAVLPLENLSGDSSQDYFADGMTEALITDLGRLGGLKRVIARGSVMRYKGTKKALPEIARELRVDALITGAVVRSGERVRITAQLIDPATDEQLWADRYERDLRDILVLQNEVTRAIANEIKVKLSPQEQARLVTARRVDPQAHEAYLQGRFYIHKLSPEGYQTALEYFQLALEKDPNYAPAHLGLDMVWLRSHMGAIPTAEGLPGRQAAVAKALELDPNLAEAHDHAAGLHLYGDWNWSAAASAFRRAFELNPNSGCMPIAYADLLLLLGRRDEALSEVNRCLELDPLNIWIQTAYGGRLLRLGRYDEGIAQLQKAVRTEPNLALAHRYLWVAFHAKGLDDQAVAEAKTWFGLSGQPDVTEAVTRGYSEGGYARAMKLAAEKLAARARSTYIQPTQIAALYAYAGERDRAFEWLDKAYEVRDSWMTFIKDDPRFEALHSDPRFAALLRRMNIPA